MGNAMIALTTADYAVLIPYVGFALGYSAAFAWSKARRWKASYYKTIHTAESQQHAAV